LIIGNSAKKRDFLFYLMAGYPTLSLTVPLMEAAVKGGADLIELGMPFSDPIADGPVIQKAGEVALAQGTGVEEVLATVAQFRKRYEQTPVVLMGYANPVAAMGYDRFAIKAAEAEVDAVLIVDLPPFREEEKYFCSIESTPFICWRRLPQKSGSKRWRQSHKVLSTTLL